MRYKIKKTLSFKEIENRYVDAVVSLNKKTDELNIMNNKYKKDIDELIGKLNRTNKDYKDLLSKYYDAKNTIKYMELLLKQMEE